MRVKVVTDSSAYLEKNLLKDLNITIISLIVNLGNRSYAELDLLDDVFFTLMQKQKQRPTTSQPPLDEIYRVFCQYVEAGFAVLAIFLSSSLSGTYSAALTARRMTLERYPDAKIEVVDSRAACMGFTVLAAARAAQEGAKLEEVLRVTLDRANRSNFLFVPASLEYLAKGGRIGEASALIGTLLNIKPVLSLQNGRIIVQEKVRTMEKALSKMIEIIKVDFNTKGLVEIGVGHVNSPHQGALLAERIQQELGMPVVLRGIGPVLGLHLGPGTLGIGYCIKA